MNPACWTSSTTYASTGGMLSCSTADPMVVGTPAVDVRSLKAVGTPQNGGESSSESRRSAAAACSSARSAVTVMNAPSASA
jgi:hypothetical protein